MTPAEFKIGLAFLDSIAPHFMAQCGLVSDDKTKDTTTGMKFWRDQLEPFTAEAFKQGCQQVVRQTNVFPNMADLLRATREAQSETLGSKDPMLALPGSAPATTPLNELALHVDGRTTEQEREDAIGRGLRLLQQRKFQVTKILRTEGMARYEHKSATVKEGDPLYSAILYYVGAFEADWDGLGRDHEANYSIHKESSRERAELHNVRTH